MGVSSEALAQGRQTISAYENYAEQYDAIVRHVPNEREQASLKRLVAIAGTGGQILEVGSGAGYDADFLENLGVKVRRTDATKRFLELQAARGKHGQLLDLITDDLGGRGQVYALTGGGAEQLNSREATPAPTGLLLPDFGVAFTEGADFANANPDGSAWDAFTLTGCSDE